MYDTRVDDAYTAVPYPSAATHLSACWDCKYTVMMLTTRGVPDMLAVNGSGVPAIANGTALMVEIRAASRAGGGAEMCGVACCAAC